MVSLNTGKIWQFPAQTKVDAGLLEAAGGSEVIARLLVRRGIRTPIEARSFLDPTEYTESSTSEFTDMPKAVMRIQRAIEAQEAITVYGDYDVDGVTGTSVLLSTLRRLGAKVEFYIPNRAAEGYGLNLKAVSVLASKHRTKLIITCDCGISNFAEINLAKSLGVDTIVVDHHSLPELLPPAVAILHPKQLNEEHPLFHLPGVGVAYKLAEALLQNRGLDEEVPDLLDFVTLGMIADMVPLVKENRYLVQIGLPRLINSKRPGLRALLANTGAMEGSDLVGFGLAPKINAVGRLSDASFAVKLMTTEDPAEAEILARQLELENARRQELCEQIFADADRKAQIALSAQSDRALALYDEGWHHGVVGIVASRLVEKYHCPVFVAELDLEEKKLKGSARGVSGIDLYQVLKANEEFFIKFGGHQMAAGFSADADKAEVLCRALVDTCNRMLDAKTAMPVLEIDLELAPSQVSLSLAHELTKLGPFGMGNKKPVFAMRNLQVLGCRPLGKEAKHHRIMLKDEGSKQPFECVFWRSSNRLPADDSFVDLAFTAEINVYNNTERLQLVLSDWRKAGDEKDAEQGEGELAAAGVRDLIQATAAGQAMPKSALRADLPNLAEADRTKAVESQPPRPPAGAIAYVWKDLRGHAQPESVIKAALRNLGDKVVVFAESLADVHGLKPVDRTGLGDATHLIIWQYPPNLQSFKTLINSSKVRNVYLLGHGSAPDFDASTFLKKLFAAVKYAVSKKDGQANPDKLAAAFCVSKIVLALGLTVLKKVNVIDWFAEDGVLNLDVIGQPSGTPDDVAEFRQLQNLLKESSEFRQWCAESPLADIQCALSPNAIRLPAAAENSREQDSSSLIQKERSPQDERKDDVVANP